MSSSTWTPDALSAEAAPLHGECWRLVEAQHAVSTLKLVDDLEEQEILEALIEDTKPAVPQDCAHLHYLLATPFRYGAPYPVGSRFRRAGMTPGVYYASEAVETALAELAFRRVLFFAESPGTPFPGNAAEYTAFSTAFGTPRAIDLTRPPLDRDRAQWRHVAEYAPCQALADSARAAAVDVIRYESVRDPDGGANLALLECGAFTDTAPRTLQTWRLLLRPGGVQAIREFPRMRVAFPPLAFAADPRTAAMRWDR
jgi:hypothetical protein